MSQPKLTLRPPPNVDFVQGYPGIPPGGPDRPQAAVKGAIEVRVGQQGVKAKWVRIELRKIETLPGGGVANTFFDFVGQSPIYLWQSPNDEYSTLHTNDFPFFIRIPESIPPTIALEKGAGVKYELIASVCVQGKKGFLRRDKPTTTATASPIIIDKHELHSTWPIYSQPETRSHSQDGVTLIAERAHTCYGPGDRVVVMATVKSDTLHTVMLRGFEYMLRETTIFRAAPHTQGKKGSPQVKVSSVGEQKVPVNATLYGGTQHKVELSVIVPPHHTSTTINAARHIDINYVLTVRALLNTGQPIVMDLPIMISNWPRAVSVEAMRRIGHAFNVSLPNRGGSTAAAQPPSPPLQSDTKFAPALKSNISASATTSPTSPSISISNSIDKKGSVSDFRSPGKGALGQYSTAPATSEKSNLGNRFGHADEFGGRKKSLDGTGAGGSTGAGTYTAQTIGATNVSSAARTRAGSGASSYENAGGPIGVVGRPRSSNGRANPAQRLTIANMSEEEMREQMEAEAERARRHPSVILESPVTTSPPQTQAQFPSTSGARGGTSPAPSAQSQSQTPKSSAWMTAEQEKERLYQLAIANVERVQGRARSSMDQSSQNGHGETVSTKSSTPANSKHWPTAEEEKARLFQQAQAAVARARGLESPDPSITSPRLVSSSSGSNQNGIGRVTSTSAGAALYSEAMSAINRPVTAPVAQPATVSSPVTPASATNTKPGSVRQSNSQGPSSALDEKAMLQRYYDAKNKVFQTQSAHYGRVPGNAGPVPYDALYPNQQATSPVPSNSYSQPMSLPIAQSPPADMPPSFAAASGSSSQHPILSEKERLRRHYEAQDAATAQQQQAQQQPWQPLPPQEEYPSSPPPNPYPISPAPDNGMRYSQATPPPTGNSLPFSSPQSPPLSAYAEKEMLRRRYEQQDAGTRTTPGTTPTPPPRASQLPNGRGRPPPTPPMSPSVVPGTPVSARQLTAVEEKARLKALYESEDRAVAAAPPPPFAQSPYPSPPPSNGFHPEYDQAYAPIPRTTPSPQPSSLGGYVPAPPPLAPRPPREYIEETRAEDLRTAAKLQAIDSVDPAHVLASLKQADPDLASIATTEPENDGAHEDGDESAGGNGNGERDAAADADARDSTFGYGTLPLAAGAPNGGPSRSGSLIASGAPRPPLPPKVLIE